MADGMPAAAVARTGLLRPRQPDTVYRWFHRYQQEGVAGLADRPGRGRKPAFSPHHPDADSAQAAVLDVVRRAPRLVGVDRTRWTLATVGAVVPWLADHTVGGVGRVLDALAIVLKRGRDYVHSPDVAYTAKRTAIAASLDTARASEGRVVALFLDEVTLHRQPSLAPAYAARGREQPLAERSYRRDATTRIIGTLDALDGRVVCRRRHTLDIPALVGFYREVVATYPQATASSSSSTIGRSIFTPISWWRCSHRRVPFPSHDPARGQPTPVTTRCGNGATCSCRSTWCRCRRMPRGSTRSRNCGAGCGRRWSISTPGLMRCPRSTPRPIASWPASRRGTGLSRPPALCRAANP